MGTLYTLYVKRCIDLTLSLALFALVSPVFIGVSLLLSLTGKGSPFFFQRRPGLRGKSFTIIKFKTMRDAPAAGATDAERLTAIGRFVRASSLDEIPQLINVIIGDMSLVGPRPLLEEYLPLYDAHQQ